jgi:hypothetical protein
MRDENCELLRDALNLYVGYFEVGAFLRFANISEIKKADRYIEFLRRLGLGKRNIELVSGDPDPASQFRNEWRDSLSETNMLIHPCEDSRKFGAKSSLSIRPLFDPLGEIGTGSAGFRFAMAMAFVVFSDNKEATTLCPSVNLKLASISNF